MKKTSHSNLKNLFWCISIVQFIFLYKKTKFEISQKKINAMPTENNDCSL